MEIIYDTLLRGIGEDKLGREPIVSLIVDSIKKLAAFYSHNCVVYGIYVKLGKVKTSLMNFRKEGHNRKVLIDFIV